VRFVSILLLSLFLPTQAHSAEELNGQGVYCAFLKGKIEALMILSNEEGLKRMKFHHQGDKQKSKGAKEEVERLMIEMRPLAAVYSDLKCSAFD
jgi:archaellum component FlaC